MMWVNSKRPHRLQADNCHMCNNHIFSDVRYLLIYITHMSQNRWQSLTVLSMILTILVILEQRSSPISDLSVHLKFLFEMEIILDHCDCYDEISDCLRWLLNNVYTSCKNPGQSGIWLVPYSFNFYDKGDPRFRTSFCCVVSITCAFILGARWRRSLGPSCTSL